MRRLALVLVCAAGCVAIPVRAVVVELVKDLDTRPGNPRGIPDHLTSLGASVAFAIRTEQRHTSELWTSNGTAAGTRMLADLDPTGVSDAVPLGSVGGRAIVLTSASSSGRTTSTLWSAGEGPGDVTRLLDGGAVLGSLFAPAAPGLLLVASVDAPAAAQLVRTDGTVAGTRVLAAFPVSGTDLAWSLTTAGTRVFMQSRSGPLWVSDGTTAGTRQVASVTDAKPGMLGFKGGIAFVGSQTAGSPASVWWTDGTSTGTRSLTSLNGTVLELGQLGNRLYWVQSDATYGQELWESDGTAQRTRRLTNLPNPKAFVENPHLYHHRLLLQASGLWMLDLSDGSGTHGWWTLKPGQTSPRRWKNCPGGCPSRIDVERVVSLGKRVVYFGGAGAAANATFSSDGTPAGTRKLPVTGGETPLSLWTLAEDKLFLFSATNLWVTDGVTTVPLIATTPQMYVATRVGSRWWIGMADQLWSSDGTLAGTRQVMAPSTATASSDLLPVTTVGSTLILCGQQSTSIGTWALSGDQLTELPIPFPNCLRMLDAPELGGVIAPGFPQPDRELWVTDGTPVATQRLDLPSMPPEAWVQDVVHWDGRLIAQVGPLYRQTEPTGFYRRDSFGWVPWLATGNSSIWLVDVAVSTPDLFFCTPGGFWRVRQGASVAEKVGPVSSCGRWAARLGAGVVSADTYGHNVRCVSGGTCSPLPVIGPTPIIGWLKTGDHIFVVDNGNESAARSLWRIDADGSVHLLGPVCGSVDRPDLYTEVHLVDLGQRVVLACERVDGVWASDGTAAGTVRVMGTGQPTGPAGGSPFLARSGTQALIRGYDLAHGVEPWITDGTIEGTRLLHDVNPGPRSSDPNYPRTTPMGTYFRAWDGAHGEEVWLATP